MSTAFEKFEELEGRIVRAVELVKSTRQELASANAQISKMNGELQELRRERDLVKNRIESLIESLSEITEEPGVQSEVPTHRR